MRRKHLVVMTLAIALMMPAWISAADAGEVHIVCMVGDLEKLKTMLTGNPDLVNSKDESGNTPLHYANSPEIALLLLDNKADIEAKENSGGTPLHAAVNSGHVDVATVLLAHGANANAKSVTGLTPLHVAALTDNADGKENAAAMAELLLANKADVRAKDIDGNTPLDWAVAKSRPKLAAVLFSHIQKTLQKTDGGLLLQFKFTKGETMTLEQKTLIEFFSGLLDTDEGSMLTLQRVRNQVESTGPTTMLSCCTEAMRAESPPGKVIFDSDNEANRSMDQLTNP